MSSSSVDRVPNQVALTRILTVASHISSPAKPSTNRYISVIADESGGLATQVGDASGGNPTGNLSSGVGGVSPLGGADRAGSAATIGVRRISPSEGLAGRWRTDRFIHRGNDLPEVRVDIRFDRDQPHQAQELQQPEQSLPFSDTSNVKITSPFWIPVDESPARQWPSRTFSEFLKRLPLTTGTQLTTSHFCFGRSPDAARGK